MGWFGGSSDTMSSGLDLSGSGGSGGSKLRTPSSELDLSDYSSDPSSSSGSGDIQMHLQKEQQKALLMSAVSYGVPYLEGCQWESLSHVVTIRSFTSNTEGTKYSRLVNAHSECLIEMCYLNL